MKKILKILKQYKFPIILSLSILFIYKLSIFLNPPIAPDLSDKQIITRAEDLVKKIKPSSILFKQFKDSTDIYYENALIFSGLNHKQAKDIKSKFIGIIQIEEKTATQTEELRLFLSPVKTFFSWVSDNFLILISTLTSVVIAYYLVRMRSSDKESTEILQPAEIKGDINDIIGLDEVKKSLDEIILMAENISLFNEVGGIHKPFNIMFSGPPGTGKTKLAGYFAKKLNWPLIVTSVGSLENKYVGVGANKLKEIHELALKQKKCIIFLDEAENLFKKRGTFNQHKHEDDSIQTFLSLLDGVSTNHDTQIIWIAASNFNNMSLEMDEAVLRRFQQKIDFRLPNKSERKNILSHYLNKINDKYKATNINLDYIAEITAELSPAILQTIIEKASVSAIHNGNKGSDNNLITTDALYKAFEVTTVGITNRHISENLINDRKKIAIHELGHFLVAFEQAMQKTNNDINQAKNEMNVLMISTESISKANALGFVLSKRSEDLLPDLHSMDWKVKELYGGVAAEELFYGKEFISTGASSDINKITQLLKAMIIDLSMYSSTKLNYSLLSDHLSQSSQENILNELQSKSEELYTNSKDVVNKHKELLKFILPTLLDKYVLNIDEIFAEINKFYQKN